MIAYEPATMTISAIPPPGALGYEDRARVLILDDEDADADAEVNTSIVDQSPLAGGHARSIGFVAAAPAAVRTVVGVPDQENDASLEEKKEEEETDVKNGTLPTHT